MELVTDANVLIDYARTDPSILTLHVRHFGPIYVPSVILNEVDQLDVAECESLGLTIVGEPLEILLAATEQRGPLSFEDQVCLLLARANQMKLGSPKRKRRLLICSNCSAKAS